MKTEALKRAIQKLVFLDKEVWISFYEQDPSDNPQTSLIEPINWEGGNRFHITDWDTNSPDATYNLSTILLNNNTGRDLTLRYFILWDQEVEGQSSYKGDASDQALTIPNGKSFTLGQYYIEIKE